MLGEVICSHLAVEMPVAAEPLELVFPASSKWSWDPVRRSQTVRETRISPPDADSMILRATTTPKPSRSSPLRSTSAVWTPMRTSIPRRRRSYLSEPAARRARLGLGNSAKMPSPMCLTTRPASASTHLAETSSCWESSRDHAESPFSVAISVDPTMSVNSRVKVSGRACEVCTVPVTNRSRCWRISSGVSQ